MAKAKFYLEPRPTPDGKQGLNLFYSFNGNRLQYYTRIRVEVKHFRPECNTSNSIPPIKTTAPNAGNDNKKLKAMAEDAARIISEARGEELTVKYVREQLNNIYKLKKIKPEPETSPEINHTFTSYFEKLIADSINGNRLISAPGKSNGKRYTPNAIKNYRVTLSALKRYLDYRSIDTLPFEAINKAFYEDFRFFCYDIEQKEKSTFGVYIKDIKTVMNESQTPGFKSKDFVSPAYEADTVYLTVDQIEKIASLDLSDKSRFIIRQKIKRDKKGKPVLIDGKTILADEQVSYSTLDKVRDMSLIGFYSGLRFSDFSKLEQQHIEGNFIKIKQTKTSGRVTIPIMSKLRTVLDKYPEALPTLSSQNFNDYFKIVGELAGLTDITKQTNHKGNTENVTFTPLYQLLSSHICRRSYATNMFKAGIPSMLIQSATGHKTESSFLKYIRASDDTKAQLLAKALQNLGL